MTYKLFNQVTQLYRFNTDILNSPPEYFYGYSLSQNGPIVDSGPLIDLLGEFSTSYPSKLHLAANNEMNEAYLRPTGSFINNSYYIKDAMHYTSSGKLFAFGYKIDKTTGEVLNGDLVPKVFLYGSDNTVVEHALPNGTGEECYVFYPSFPDNYLGASLNINFKSHNGKIAFQYRCGSSGSVTDEVRLVSMSDSGAVLGATFAPTNAYIEQFEYNLDGSFIIYTEADLLTSRYRLKKMNASTGVSSDIYTYSSFSSNDEFAIIWDDVFLVDGDLIIRVNTNNGSTVSLYNSSTHSVDSSSFGSFQAVRVLKDSLSRVVFFADTISNDFNTIVSINSFNNAVMEKVVPQSEGFPTSEIRSLHASGDYISFVNSGRNKVSSYNIVTNNFIEVDVTSLDPLIGQIDEIGIENYQVESGFLYGMYYNSGAEDQGFVKISLETGALSKRSIVSIVPMEYGQPFSSFIRGGNAIFTYGQEQVTLIAEVFPYPVDTFTMASLDLKNDLSSPVVLVDTRAQTDGTQTAATIGSGVFSLIDGDFYVWAFLYNFQNSFENNSELHYKVYFY